MRPRDLPQQTCPHEAGYEDLNDAERLSQDPTFRLIGSEKIWERGAALPSRLHWFETEVLQTAGSASIEKSLRNVTVRRDGRIILPFSRSKRRFQLKAPSA